MFESGVKHHQTNKQTDICGICLPSLSDCLNFLFMGFVFFLKYSFFFPDQQTMKERMMGKIYQIKKKVVRCRFMEGMLG